MAGPRQAPRDPRDPGFRREQGAYVLIVRGPDGRPRFERFDDAAAYRARLIALQHSSVGNVSIDELVGLLDA